MASWLDIIDELYEGSWNTSIQRFRSPFAFRGAGRPQLWRKVPIPARLEWEIRDKLDQANVNERGLFPGLDGLSRWLARYYTPAGGAAGVRTDADADPRPAQTRSSSRRALPTLPPKRNRKAEPR